MRARTGAVVALAIAVAIGALEACGDILATAPGDDAGVSEGGDVSSADVNETDAPGDAGVPFDAGQRGDCGDEAGSVMVRIGASCMDSTEVTVGDYRAFVTATLDGSPDAVAPLTTACAAQQTFVPQAGWPRPPGDDPVAITDVDWCDAWAYCRFVGKRLCKRAEWFDTCTAGGTRSFAYGGDTYIEDRCLVGKPRLVDGNPYPVERVANRPDCRDPSLPIYDLGGNAQEWTDVCNDDSPQSPCEVREPGSSAPASQATCASTIFAPRDQAGGMVGFRCCLSSAE